MTLPTPIHLLPTAQELCALLDYEPTTGIFTWRVSCGRVKSGSFAGSVHPDGYRRIRVSRRAIVAHRIAWAISTGKWPVDQIDHVNGIRDDNRLANLREATQAQNQQNQQNQRRAQGHSKSGYLGVCFHKDARKWQAQIGVAGKVRHLGNFATAELAHAAYVAAKAVLHPFQTITNTNEKG